ncbi:transcriptional regulator, TetR family [Lentzea fradiae]|uniref:Transcriptional regulator, TetR family n=1 Tax=Lentzea fradiae TaxID=200378 RepID=A0A1G7KF47_9PSEU|nr:TetR/AcrR family transcriptional regulator [Lentzea fradiae]SDF35812.1 transcriptional regulator, TetR family [Lentzea fradiae]
MPSPARHDEQKAARILSAAQELILKRGYKGVTISDIAERAHIGKGTVYLYWQTKEDIFVELLANEILTVIEVYLAEARRQPELTLPHRFCAHIVRAALDRPLARALQTHDAELLGIIIDHPRSQDLLHRHGASALITGLLPIWREHGVIRADWQLDDQAYALQVLTVGHLQMQTHPEIDRLETATSPDEVLSAATEALLGVTDVKPGGLQALSSDVLAFLGDSAKSVREFLLPSDR